MAHLHQNRGSHRDRFRLGLRQRNQPRVNTRLQCSQLQFHMECARCYCKQRERGETRGETREKGREERSDKRREPRAGEKERREARGEKKRTHLHQHRRRHCDFLGLLRDQRLAGRGGGGVGLVLGVAEHADVPGQHAEPVAPACAVDARLSFCCNTLYLW